MSSPGIGPAREHVPPAQRDPDRFARTVGTLTEGALRFPAPFDLAASAALADNPLTGTTAERLFEAVRAHLSRRFHIQVHEVIGDAPEPWRREVVDCVCDPAVAVALLLTVAAELHPDPAEEHIHG